MDKYVTQQLKMLFVAIGLVFIQSVEAEPLVSFYKLISIGYQYNQREIVTVGVLFVDYRSSVIYPNRESYELKNNADAIIVAFGSQFERAELKKLNGKFVKVYGIYEHFNHSKKMVGHMHHISLLEPIE